MKAEIITLITNKPKHYAKLITNNADLLNWVTEHSLIISDYLPANIFSAIYQQSNICKYGNVKKFNSISTGFIGCGRASVCKCTNELVSNGVSITKSKTTIANKLITNNKRSTTNLEKYGVPNVGQSINAIKSHNATYANAGKVANIVKKVANTKLIKYGNASYNNADKMKATYKEKYKTAYWVERYNNPNLFILNDKAELEKLYQTMNPYELATLLEVHVQTIYRYLNLHKLREPFKSEPEREIVRFLNELGVTNIIQNTRKLLPSRREIDIYLPDFNIAIEYNGVYWHHEAISHITKTYHYEKFKECADLDIQLITIFSNFWNLKKPIVKQALVNKIGISPTAIHARKCKIKSIDATIAKQFLTANHVQGYAASSFKYGLIYNDELVSLMTFGKSRIGIGNFEDGVELIRYASSHRVMGGASRLLHHFIKLHNPTKIVSYSDNEWSDGNLYKILGFTLEREIPPSYWYVTPRSEHLYHRFNFSKQKLKDKGHDTINKSVIEITKELGLLKIWDCGKKRWVK
jgi:G:T-mismatch repair DNA endonuclease (very short patch repair protein)